MQSTPVAGASWMVPLILLSNLEIGAGQVTCGSDEFLQAGSCHPCPQCPDGEQLSHECGAGAECVPCPPDYYSNATTRPQCWPCTDCNVENKVQELSCRPNHNAVCGRCLEGYFQFAGRFCHHCSIEPTIPYCVDWLAQQTTTGQPGTTENLWKTSSSTGNKQDVVTDSYVKHYIHWDPGTISVTVILTAIALITAAACIARKWECRCYSGAHDNTIREEPEKQDLGMIEQGITGSQNGGQIHDNDNLGDQSSANLDSGHAEFTGTTDGSAVSPGDEGAGGNSQKSQNGQAAKGKFYLDLKKKALEATADIKLEDLNQDQRDCLAKQLNPEPSALGVHKNWRHFACYFNIDNMHINNWQGMKNVLDYLENSTHVTVPDIIEAIDSIGRVKVVESFCQSLFKNEEHHIDSVNV